MLDLGSGQGASAWYLTREGHTAIQVDGSGSALFKARQRFIHEGMPFSGARCDLTRLPFADKAFPVVVDIVAMAHNTMADFSQILKEVARVLQPGGQLFSMLPTNKCSRRTFKGYIVNFFEHDEVDMLMSTYFTNLQILKSTYQLAPDCTVENWVVTGAKRLA